ncbi:MAG TPA: hypothetical protein ENJ20_04160 [Bacteroidetes bacterium]|nr:hypothetical protein [Bacteroidota bacterium]
MIKEGEERLREDAGPQKGVFCKNTGVVLLHPFLPRFFQSIGLTGEKEKVFQNNKKRSGAVHWLHYMATGETRASEEELTFQKFLCGLRITEPLPPVSIDDKKHLAMADDMLRAVIEHWKALKNTSPDGLREGFLQRSGRLTQKQNGYLLQPENKTQDILLGQLPWGLSVVRLPWMEHTLWVEW